MPPDMSTTSVERDLSSKVQELERELAEAHRREVATTEVLRAISRSAFELQLVMDTLVESAARLCDADAWLFRRQGEAYHWAASYGFSPERHERIKAYFKQRKFIPNRGMTSMRAALEGRPVHIVDVLADPEFTHVEAQEIGGFRTTLGVPLLRDGVSIGVLTLTRPQVNPFTDKQIELLTTFADQAVIAIENTRLFEEVQARTRELSYALEQQTAASEILRAISRSPAELEPVFQAVLENAVRLCEAKFGIFYLSEGDAFRVVAMHGVPPAYNARRSREPTLHPRAGGNLDIVRRSKQPEHIADITTHDAYAGSIIAGEAAARTLLTVPLLRDGQVIGAINICRQEVRRFADKQIELVKSFASQAVIAIENTRLLNELHESLQQQTATADVLKAISRSALDLQSVLNALVASASELCEAPMVAIHVERDTSLPSRARHGFSANMVEALRKIGQVMGRGSLAGRTNANGRPVHIPDVEADLEYTFHDFTRITRARSMLGVPLLRDGRPIGLLSLYRTRVAPFTPRQIELMATFADQAVIAIENVRLFEEIAQKSRELEIASQHKSQFVANMSHELRTPLAAILGYAELIQEGFYGELPEKSMDALTRIRSNGKHLLGLINTVLDIAKIESGQFSLNIAEYALENVVETVRAATESLAETKKLSLMTDVAKSLPIGLGDEQRLTQVLLNLVGNAIKFTDSGGVRVVAKAVDGHFAVSVADTGPGIPTPEQTRIFDQFHQVDSSNTKAKGGTGLGLAIAKQIVEMHGGRIWVESTLGKGATFQIELPTRAAFDKSVP
jgi:signal transduction histidine kinase